MRKSKNTIKNVGLLLLMLPFLEPLSFYEYAAINNVFFVLKIASAITVGFIVAYLLLWKKIKLDRAITYIILYSIMLVISSLVAALPLGPALRYSIPIISMSLLGFVWIWYDRRACLKYLTDVLFIYTVINIITIIIYDFFLKGSVASFIHFLGEDNRAIFIFLPQITFSSLRYIFDSTKSNFRFLIVNYVMEVATIAYLWSVGALIGLLMYGTLLYILFKKTKLFNVLFKLRNVFICYFLICLSIFVFNAQEMLMPIFLALFNKQQTLESRFMLWDLAKGYISKNLVLGYGIEETVILRRKFIVAHAHNTLLHMIYQSGIVGMLFIVAFFVRLGKIYKKNNNNLAKGVTSISTFVFLILGIADTLNHALFFLMFVIVFAILLFDVTGDKKEYRERKVV